MGRHGPIGGDVNRGVDAHYMPAGAGRREGETHSTRVPRPDRSMAGDQANKWTEPTGTIAKGVEAEDPARSDLSKGACMRKVMVVMAIHDPAHNFASLNIDEIAREGYSAGMAKAPTAAIKVHTGTVVPYNHQTTIIIKNRCVAPLRTGAPGRSREDEVQHGLRILEESLNEALRFSGWEVLKGKARQLSLKRRSLRGMARGKGAGLGGGKGKGKGGGKGQGEGGGQGKGGETRAPRRGQLFDAVSIAVGTRQQMSSGKAVIPSKLSVTHPMKGTPVIISGAKDTDPDFRVSGQKFFANLSPQYKPGFYDTQVGKELQRDAFRPQGEKQEMEAMAITQAIELATGCEACVLFVEKTVRRAQAQSYLCNPKRNCDKQPCALAARSENFSIEPIMRQARQHLATLEAQAAQVKQEQAERNAQTAEKMMLLMVAKQKQADAQYEAAARAAQAQCQAPAAMQAPQAVPTTAVPTTGAGAAPSEVAAGAQAFEGAAATRRALRPWTAEATEAFLADAAKGWKATDEGLARIPEDNEHEAEGSEHEGTDKGEVECDKAWLRYVYFIYKIRQMEADIETYQDWQAIAAANEREDAKARFEYAMLEKGQLERQLHEAKTVYLKEAGEDAEEPQDADLQVAARRDKDGFYEGVEDEAWEPRQMAKEGAEGQPHQGMEVEGTGGQPQQEMAYRDPLPSATSSLLSSPMGGAREPQPPEGSPAAQAAEAAEAARQGAAEAAQATRAAALQLQMRQEEAEEAKKLADSSAKRKAMMARLRGGEGNQEGGTEDKEQGQAKQQKPTQDGDATMAEASAELGLHLRGKGPQPPALPQQGQA